jgi:hypothetical protein
MADAPEWAALLGDGYAHFREVLVGVLTEMQLAVDPDHIDCGVLHRPDGTTMGLTNVVRLCAPAPRERWPAIIAEHIRRSSAKAVPMAFEVAAPRLRLRLVPDRHVQMKPEAYVGRLVGRELHAVVAIDNPEHVVFVNQKEPGEWGRTADELYELALRNTRSEPALEPHEVDVPDGPKIVALLGESYFAASHVLFLERYAAPGEHGHVIAVPDRHAVVALPIADPRWMAGLGTMVGLAHVRFTESPGAITDQLYWRRADGVLIKIACGVRDDGGPWVAPPEEFNEMVAKLG